MIDRLIKLYNQDLSYKSLVYRHFTLKDKVTDHFPLIYLIVIVSGFFLVIFPQLRWLVLLPLILLIDLILATFFKFKYSFIGFSEKRQQTLKMTAFRRGNNVTNKSKTFRKSFRKYQEKEIERFLKSKCSKIVLEGIKHRENQRLNKILFFIGAFALIIYTQIDKALSVVPLFKRFNIQFQQILEYPNKDEPGYNYVLMGFITLAVGFGFIYAFFLATPYFIGKSYVDIKFSKLGSLRTLVENIAMKKE